MQQYYRIALGMCLLIGYLQAQPVKTGYSINEDDLRMSLLKGVTCKPNMTFTCPKGMKEPCYNATLKLKEEWEHARENCSDPERIDQIVDVLKKALNTTTTQCDFTATVYEQFGTFVNATLEFAQEWNSQQ